MKDRINYLLKTSFEYFLHIQIINKIFLLYCFVRHYWFKYLIKNSYEALAALLKYQRIIVTIGDGKCPKIVNRVLGKYVDTNISTQSGTNRFVSSYIQGPKAMSYQKEFMTYGIPYQLRLKYPRKNDNPRRQGDLLLLKQSKSDNEKGLIFVKYNETVNKMVAVYDIARLADYYRFVIEPSTWGYQDPIFFFLMGLNTEVIIESQFAQDYNYIASIGRNLYPIHLGAGDWVDPEIFSINENMDKKYDFVMIASWLSIKRHSLFFKSISKISSEIKKVAVVGYPISDRTLDDIISESKKYNVTHLVDFYEKLKPKDVAIILQQSKVSLMLTKREGANKALYESFFSNVPVILTNDNIGVNRNHINKYTGVCAHDKDLSQSMLFMLRNYKSFSPRPWALMNTGYINSNTTLNAFIKEIALSKGEKWTQQIHSKKNCPEAVFVNENEMYMSENAIEKLVQFLRK
jgi:hypothetical protein